MRVMLLLLLVALCAPPADAATIMDFYKQCRAKGLDVITVEDHGSGDIRLQFGPSASASDKDQAELDKTQFDFSHAPDTTKQEIETALQSKAADDKVSDAEYAKIIRIQNIQDKSKRDAEWQKLKPDLDKTVAH